jgi:hypothetical protein
VRIYCQNCLYELQKTVFLADFVYLALPWLAWAESAIVKPAITLKRISSSLKAFTFESFPAQKVTDLKLFGS